MKQCKIRLVLFRNRSLNCCFLKVCNTYAYYSYQTLNIAMCSIIALLILEKIFIIFYSEIVL